MRFGFRLKTLMASVAIAALMVTGFIEAARLSRLAEGYAKRASDFAEIEAYLSNYLSVTDRRIAELRAEVVDTGVSASRESYLDYLSHFVDSAAKERTRVAIYGRLRAKYQSAAARPWLPLPSGPPEPYAFEMPAAEPARQPSVPKPVHRTS